MFGNARIWWENKYGKWKTIHTSVFGTIYQENTKTSKRRARGHKSMMVDKQWLAGGEWCNPYRRLPQGARSAVNVKGTWNKI